MTLLGIYSKIMVFDSGIFALKWVAVARHGLILWENDATHLTSLLKSVLDLKIDF